MNAIEQCVARDEIRQLMARYNLAGDTGRREEFANVFSDDAELSAPGFELQTSKGIVQGLFAAPGASATAAPKYKIYRHHLTTSSLDFVSEVAAIGRSYFLVVTDIGLDHSGVYTDKFKREDGVWKIATRKVRLDYVAPQSHMSRAPQT